MTGVDSGGEPHGITIGSFTSISLDPPLVGFFPGVSSKSWPRIAESGNFCVNVLADSQAELCWRFAKEADNRFDGVEWTAATDGSPVLAGSIAWIHCSVHSVTEVGDHFFVVGKVNDLSHAEPSPDAMAFFRGKVTSVHLSD